jgi:hypothetical protein
MEKVGAMTTEGGKEKAMGEIVAINTDDGKEVAMEQ